MADGQELESIRQSGVSCTHPGLRRAYGIFAVLFSLGLFAPGAWAELRLEWAATISGSGKQAGNAIAVDGAGNVYTLGSFGGTVDFDPGPGVFNLSAVGDDDIFVQKLDAKGHFVWARAMGGSGWASGRGIAVDNTGNVYTTGYFQDKADFDPGPDTFHLTSAGDTDVFLQKLDASGHFVWARTLGGKGSDRIQGIAVDDAGKLFTMGLFQETLNLEPDPNPLYNSNERSSSIVVQKRDGDGTVFWARAGAGTNYDREWRIAVDGAGNVYTTGYFQKTENFDPFLDGFNLTSAGKSDIFVQKLDTSSNLLWARSMGSRGEDRGMGIAVDGAGYVYTTGSFQRTVDFDPGPDTFNLSSAGKSDIFVQKLDAQGRLIWAHSIGGRGDDHGMGIAVDGAGNVYITGSFQRTVDFDPGPDAFNLTSAGKRSFFVIKLSPDVTPP